MRACAPPRSALTSAPHVQEQYTESRLEYAELIDKIVPELQHYIETSLSLSTAEPAPVAIKAEPE
jgi:hypothetical protein